MAEKKITKREMFEGIKATLVENFDEADVAEYVEFIDTQIAAIDAKNEKEKAKRAEKKAQGDALGGAVAEAIFNADGAITAEEIASIVEVNSDIEDVTRAKVTYRASQLAKEGRVYKVNVKTEDGRKVVAYTKDAPVEE